MSNFWGAVQYILPFLYIKVWIAFARGGNCLYANIYVF